MQVHVGSFVCFPYFLCYNSAFMGWKTAIKRGRNLMEGVLHPYKRVDTPLWKCLYILMQSSFNVFECPFNVFECRFNVFERRNDKDAETNSLWFNDFSLWFTVFSCPLLALFLCFVMRSHIAYFPKWWLRKIAVNQRKATFLHYEPLWTW